MKTKLRAITAGFLLVLLFSCKNEELNLNTTLTYGLGDVINLQEGDSAWVRNENITIVFSRLVSDSRCPQGVVCIWSGEAIGELQFTKGNASFRFTASTIGGSLAMDDYTVNLIDVLPYPDIKKPQPSKYSAKIIIQKLQYPLLKGTAKNYKGLDGCGFVIELDNGTKLEPINPSFPFRDDQRVALAYTPLSDVVTTCMVGQPAKIDEIYQLVE